MRVKGEGVYGGMNGQPMRELGKEDTMWQRESRLCIWVFLRLLFQSNIAKSSKTGFGCKDSSSKDGYGIRN